MALQRIILSGVSTSLLGRRWESDHILRIGSLDHLEVVLPDPSISERHAEVLATDQGWLVRDLGSARGTFVNGQPVGAEGQKLHHQDVLRVGDLSLQVTLLEQQVQATLKTAQGVIKIQATAQCSWQQALQVLARCDDPQPWGGRHLLTFLRAGYHLRHIASLEGLLQSVLDDTVALLAAQRGCIALVEETSGQLQMRAVSVRRSGASAQNCFSQTLAQQAFGHGESLLCQDVSQATELQAAQSIRLSGMSSIICALLRSPRQQLGVLHLDRGPLQEPFTEHDFLLADAIAASVSAGIESAQLVAKQRELFLKTVRALARAVEYRDQYTAGHTQRVTDYAAMLAEELKLSATEQEYLQVGTPLHDIGKIGIQDAVLQKPGKLTAEEFEHMKTHTMKGAALLEPIPDLKPIIPIIRHHHERWDGQGYPDNLSREAISPLARVVAVADAFDAMTSDRPYRPAFRPDRAFAEIQDGAGVHFDPACARAFLRLRPRIEARLPNLN